jgi:hypothetical protein
VTPHNASDQGQYGQQGGRGALHNDLDSNLNKDLDKEFFGSREGSREGSRGWSCEVAPMTNYQAPLINLNANLAMHCRHGGSEHTLQRLVAGGLEMNGAATLSELAAQCNQTDNRARAEDILRPLVGLAGEDSLAALSALVALYPALVGIARRLIAAGVLADQADMDVIAVAYERILELSEDPPRHVARAVISGTWDRIRSSLKAEQRCALRHCRLEQADVQAVVSEEGADSGPLSEVLVDAVAAGVISSEAARVIYGTRVEGRSMGSLACDVEKREAAVRKIRTRAERALVETFRLRAATSVMETHRELSR